ncbi:hypothetical protein [Ovoidimarina sediminis]|uniref:hypothetical protein n=1 Tax=Ovoidimarina sediminis TaxID=3079856 RepID=UPI00291157FE|nr:hypothetical protein [Rhodophyticola sp. MJ-SS7]MDU8944989.1 hypothetical protein [Rhodophyticola sp. MJ-SS7]
MAPHIPVQTSRKREFPNRYSEALLKAIRTGQMIDEAEFGLVPEPSEPEARERPRITFTS